MSEPENNERTESTVATPSIREVERELARHRFKLFLCGVALLLPVLLAIKIWSGAEEERRTAKIVARLDGQSRRLDDTEIVQGCSIIHDVLLDFT